MSELSHLNTLPQVGSRMPKENAEFADSNDLLSDRFVKALTEEWQAKVQSLEGWICELLIKNQQLRLTLMEMKVGERGNRDL